MLFSADSPVIGPSLNDGQVISTTSGTARENPKKMASSGEGNKADARTGEVVNGDRYGSLLTESGLRSAMEDASGRLSPNGLLAVQSALRALPTAASPKPDYGFPVTAK